MQRGSSRARRVELLGILETSSEPVTGSELSSRLGVSRQAIVNDIAILRAAGNEIVGGQLGYAMGGHPGGIRAIVPCFHEPHDGRAEFEAFVDNGVTVLDVGVNHSVFGEVRAKVVVASRADIDRHADAIREAGEIPLSAITRGIHDHAVVAPSREALEAAKRTLRERGILREE